MHMDTDITTVIFAAADRVEVSDIYVKHPKSCPLLAITNFQSYQSLYKYNYHTINVSEWLSILGEYPVMSTLLCK